MYSYVSNWYKWSKYVIQDGIIMKTPDSVKIHYNPFDYYNNPNIVAAKKSPRPETESRAIHLWFISLDITDENSILNWVNRFGLPFSYYVFPDERTVCTFPEIFTNRYSSEFLAELSSNPFDDSAYHYNDTQELSLTTFAETVTKCKLLVDYHKGILARDEEEINRILEEKIFQDLCYESSIDVRNRPEPWDEFVNDEQFRQTWDESGPDSWDCKVRTFEGIIDEMLHGSVATIEFDTSKKIAITKSRWGFSSLLSAIYRMFYLDWTSSRQIRQCAKRGCSEYFIAKRDDRLYCSHSCQTAQNQWNHRHPVAE